MENRRFDRNSVRLQLPKPEIQLPRQEGELKANDEDHQPLLYSRQPNASALKNSKLTGRNELHVPRLAIPKKKRTCSLSGLVASNDFFIPGPLTTTSKSVHPPTPSCTRRNTTIVPQTPRTPRIAMTSRLFSLTPRTPRTPRIPKFSLMTPRTPRKEVLADSLRGQFTPRHSSKGGVDFSKKGNWSGGFLGKAIRGRDWFQRPTSSPTSYQSVSNTTSCGDAIDLEKKLQEQGLTPIYCPEPQCDNKLRFGNVASMIADLRVFLTRPIPKDFGPIECYIRRQVHAKWMIPSYRLYLIEEDHFLLASKKRKKTKSSYIISLDEHDTSKQSGNYFGKLCSNFIGSEYWFYDKGARPLPVVGVCGTTRLPTTKNRIEMGAIKFHINVLGMAGPRQMTAIIPSLQEDGKPHVFPPTIDGGPIILDDYKCGQHRDKMIIMHNKQPRFNKQLAAYCLNFNGRVTKPSVKNFQLVADSNQETIILQFGKIGRNLFTMDYQHPMSALQVHITNFQSNT